MVKATRITETYEAGEHFLVDIVETDECYESWLYDGRYGIKILMFGLNKEQTSKEEAIQLTENNLEFYIPEYIKECWD